VLQIRWRLWLNSPGIRHFAHGVGARIRRGAARSCGASGTDRSWLKGRQGGSPHVHDFYRCSSSRCRNRPEPEPAPQLLEPRSSSIYKYGSSGSGAAPSLWAARRAPGQAGHVVNQLATGSPRLAQDTHTAGGVAVRHDCRRLAQQGPRRFQPLLLLGWNRRSTSTNLLQLTSSTTSTALVLLASTSPHDSGRRTRPSRGT
jgi:hypothetical protein